MARILVTGDTGFIGRRLCQRLLDEGHTPLGISIDNVDVPWDHRVMSMADFHEVAALVREMVPEAVVHLAFIIRGDNEENVGASEVNLQGTRNLIKALEGNRAKFVFASTCAVYGDSVEDCISEGPPRPSSNYSRDKLATEQIIHDEVRCNGGRATILRFGNVYGPGDSRSVIAKILLAAREKRPFVVFSGQRIRDYVHVDDVTAAILAAVELASPGYCILNVGSGCGIEVRELVSLARSITGRDIPLREEGGPEHYVERCVVSITETERELGWRPSISLEKGIRSIWEGSVDG
ncbi:MAG: NAD(P)-dependent oxidoreductase [Candidatus Undinarchaeales archaeon]|nr:NAD(P)-dependent oxidoreductase [Candidatus Undinarchaeales archaeon]